MEKQLRHPQHAIRTAESRPLVTRAQCDAVEGAQHPHHRDTTPGVFGKRPTNCTACPAAASVDSQSFTTSSAPIRRRNVGESLSSARRINCGRYSSGSGFSCSFIS